MRPTRAGGVVIAVSIPAARCRLPRSGVRGCLACPVAVAGCSPRPLTHRSREERAVTLTTQRRPSIAYKVRAPLPDQAGGGPWKHAGPTCSPRLRGFSNSNSVEELTQ